MVRLKRMPGAVSRKGGGRFGYSDLIANMSARKALGYVRDIAHIGNRWLATKGESRARDYIRAKFRQLGLEDVHTEEFAYLHYAPARCRLEITQPVKHVFRCQPLEYSANGTVEAEVVYAGAGTEAEFKHLERIGVDVRGKIVAVSSFAPFLLTPRCARRKVAGMIVICDAPKNYIRRLTARLEPTALNPTPPFEKYLAPYPGAIIAADGGAKLLSLLSAGKVRTSIEHRGTYTKKTSSNVVGTRQGKVEPEKKVIVGGHYDSQLAGPGAADNGTGIAGALEMARVTRRRKPRRTIVFIAFSAEEIGLIGSAAYAKSHSKDLAKNAVGMLNLDHISSVFPAENTIWATKDIAKLAKKKAAEAKWKVESIVDPNQFVFSDYYPFMRLGIPSTWIWEYPPIHPYYHTENDVVEYVDATKLLKGIEVNARLAFHLAYAATLS